MADDVRMNHPDPNASFANLPREEDGSCLIPHDQSMLARAVGWLVAHTTDGYAQQLAQQQAGIESDPIDPHPDLPPPAPVDPEQAQDESQPGNEVGSAPETTDGADAASSSAASDDPEQSQDESQPGNEVGTSGVDQPSTDQSSSDQGDQPTDDAEQTQDESQPGNTVGSRRRRPRG